MDSFSNAACRLLRIGSLGTFFCCALLFAPHWALAQKTSDTTIWRDGSLPHQGTVVIRSGMAWLDESSLIFQKMSAALAKELTARGLTIVSRPPSKLDPMPKTPMPSGAAERYTENPPAPARGTLENDKGKTQKAAELGQEGKLPKLKLRSYGTPKNDADLPASVRSVAPPDVSRALYARSQEQGLPIVRSFTIPGRIPDELTGDADVADYAIVARFASVRALALTPLPRINVVGVPGISIAAATVKGVGALGFGPPAAPAPPGRDTYGTPGGYMRGYEGVAPNDFWHRDKDFFQRDYQFKYGPQPNYATPPSSLTPARQTQPGGGTLPTGRGSATFSEWHVLLLDAFALAPVKKGKKPECIWRSAARKPGEAQNFTKILPELAQILGSTKD